MATGDQTIINIPRESTMREIAQSLQAIAFNGAADLENLSTWAQISGLVNNGMAPKIFNFGDWFEEK